MKELSHIGVLLAHNNTLIVVIGTLIAILTYLHTRESVSLSHLSPKLDELTDKGILDAAKRFATIDPWIPLINARTRNEAFEFLLEVERCAKRDAHLSHWQSCLRYDDLDNLKKASQNLFPLVKLVRDTDIPLEKHVWNGVRRHAFRSTYRLLAGKH